jgi:hypothetical protein
VTLLPLSLGLVTDDAAYDGTWIYLGGEVTPNGGYCRINASTLTIQVLDLPGATYGMAYCGTYVWNCDIVNNQLSRLDPNTLEVVNFALNTSQLPNEIVTDGTHVFYFTWNSAYANSSNVTNLGSLAYSMTTKQAEAYAVASNVIAAMETALPGTPVVGSRDALLVSASSGGGGGTTTNFIQLQDVTLDPVTQPIVTIPLSPAIQGVATAFTLNGITVKQNGLVLSSGSGAGTYTASWPSTNILQVIYNVATYGDMFDIQVNVTFPTNSANLCRWWHTSYGGTATLPVTF